MKCPNEVKGSSVGFFSIGAFPLLLVGFLCSLYKKGKIVWGCFEFSYLGLAIMKCNVDT